MSGTLIASDLDRTLIYSAAAAPSGGLVADPQAPGTADLVVVERYEGRDISFMTRTAAAALAELATRQVVVPVTTRTPAQLARVRLPGPAPRYAIAANGGVLLVDGVPDPAWTARTERAVAGVAPLATALAEFTRFCDPAWAGQPRVAADLFCHVVVETPVKLTDKQKELLREFERSTNEGGAKHSPQSKGWMDKVKDFFE